MQNHGGHCGLAMAASHDHASFGFSGKPQKLGVALNAQAQLLGTKQFGIVRAGVHPQDDDIQIRRDATGIPAFLVREQPCSGQPSAAGLEDLVVAACDVMPRICKGQREVVHGASANGNEVYPHEGKFTSFEAMCGRKGQHFLTFAP